MKVNNTMHLKKKSIKTTFKKYIIVLLLLPMFAFTAHKYYMSMCEIDYIKEQASLQITLGVFTDDLEHTLNKNYLKDLRLDTPQEVKNIDSIYHNYLKKHLQITVNNNKKIFSYIGKEYDDNIVRFYLEIENVKTLQTLNLSNTILLRDFEEQKNIVKIKVENLHKTFYLNRQNDKALLKF